MQNELEHFGIVGMKWGVRRYQNPDGSLTAAGRARYGVETTRELKKQIKAENNVAFEKGRQATIDNSASDISYKRLTKAQKKYDAAKIKNPNNIKKLNKLNDRLQLESDTYDRLHSDFVKSDAEAKAYCRSLIDKYGSENVKGITYDKKGLYNERVVSNGTAATAILLSAVGSTVLAPVGAVAIASPKGRKELANDKYMKTYLDIAKSKKSNNSK